MKLHLLNICLTLGLFSALLQACNGAESNEAESVGDTSTVVVKGSNDKQVTEKEEDINYDFYYNSRFDFCMKYPDELLESRGESINGDGCTFVNEEKQYLLKAWGMHQIFPMDELYHDAISKEGRSVEYSVKKVDHFVVSGMKDGLIYYEKLKAGESRFYQFYLEYPPADSAIFDQIIPEISIGFPVCPDSVPQEIEN